MIWVKADNTELQRYTDIGHDTKVQHPPIAWLYANGQFLNGENHERIVAELFKMMSLQRWNSRKDMIKKIEETFMSNWHGRFDFENEMVSVEKLSERYGEISKPDPETTQAIKNEYAKHNDGIPLPDGRLTLTTQDAMRVISWNYNNWLTKIS